MTDVRLLGLMVTRNEAARYLGESLARLVDQCDQVLVYDDGSTDATCDIARDCGAFVRHRPSDGVSFAQHEAGFRQAAWDLLPGVEGDVVISVDADELVSLDARGSVEAIVNDVDAQCWYIPKHEVFAVDPDGTPLVRVDGYWGNITDRRICRWHQGLQLPWQRLAGGSVPNLLPAVHVTRPALVHLGYLTPEDRRVKYDRYVGQPGHSRSHIESILTKPTLRRLE